MSFGFSIGDIYALAKTIHNLHDSIAAHYSLLENDRATRTLDSSTQKLDLWITTWLGSQAKNPKQLEILWGNDGWTDIQTLLEEIKVTSTQFEDRDPSIQSRASFRPWYKIPTSSAKQKRRIQHDSASKALAMALELDKRIDQLWAYTDVIFASLHRLLSQEKQNAASSGANRAVSIRLGAVSLYRAAQRSKKICAFCVDTYFPLSNGEKPKRSTDSPLMTAGPGLNPCYRLLIEPEKPKEVAEEICLENILVLDDDFWLLPANEPSLKAINCASPTDLVRIQTRVREPPHIESIFRVLQKSTVSSGKIRPFSPSIFQYDREKPTDQKLKLPSLAERTNLALSFAQSCFFLLGTPWLADLSSKRLERYFIDEKPAAFAWKNGLLDLEELARRDGSALSESSQLFRIGVILMKLATGPVRPKDSGELDHPLIWATRQLPDVQMIAGAEYSRACEFCIKGHGSVEAEAFNRPEKYTYVKKTGWNTYISNLLNEYEHEVLSRLRRVMEALAL